MTRTEMEQKLAKQCDCTQKKAGELIKAFCELVGDELKAGNTVSIMGFGKFTASKVKGREGKNPQNPKETLVIPDTIRVYFSSGQQLKDKVNERLTKKASKPAKASSKKDVKGKKKKK